MLLRGIRIPLFMKVGNKLLSSLWEILQKNNLYFSEILMITTSHLHELLKSELENSDISENTLVYYYHISSNNIREVNKLRKRVRNSVSPLVIGLGGGKVIDVAKYSAYLERRNFLSVPTTLSHDGIASPIAVIKILKRNKSLGAQIPIGIICDTEIIYKAPRRTLRAGIGDLISNLSAIEDWRLAAEKGIELLDDFAISISKMSALHIFAQEPSVKDKKFLEELAKSLVLSGIAMEVAGSSRPCSGAEHKFSHALDWLLPNKTSLHGEQVGLGTILATYLRGLDFESYKNFFRKAGLPLNYKDINIPKEEILKALIYATKTRPERYTILEEIGVNGKLAEKACKETGII